MTKRIRILLGVAGLLVVVFFGMRFIGGGDETVPLGSVEPTVVTVAPTTTTIVAPFTPSNRDPFVPLVHEAAPPAAVVTPSVVPAPNVDPATTLPPSGA